MPPKSPPQKSNSPSPKSPKATPSVTSLSSSPELALQRLQAFGRAGISAAQAKQLQQTIGNRAIQRMVQAGVVQRVLTPEEQIEKTRLEKLIKDADDMKGRAGMLARKAPEYASAKAEITKLLIKAGKADPAEVERQRREAADSAAAARDAQEQLTRQLRPIKQATNAVLRRVEGVLTPLTATMTEATTYEVEDIAALSARVQAVAQKVSQAQTELSTAPSVEAANAAKAKAEAAETDVTPLPPLVQQVSKKVELLKTKILTFQESIKPLLAEVRAIGEEALQLLVPVTTYAIANKEELKLEIQAIKTGAIDALARAGSAPKLAIAKKSEDELNTAIVEMTAAKAKAVNIGQKEIAYATDVANQGHVVGRHGPEIASKKVFDRLATGIAPDGARTPAGNLSSQFASYMTLNSTMDTVKPLIRKAMVTGATRVIAKIKLYGSAKLAFETAQRAVETYVPAPVPVSTTAAVTPPTPTVDTQKAKLEKDRDAKEQLMTAALAAVHAEVTAVNADSKLCNLYSIGGEADPAKLVQIATDYQIVHDHGGVIGKGFTRRAADENDHIDLERTRTKFAYDLPQPLIGGNINVDTWKVVQHFPTNEAVGLT